MLVQILGQIQEVLVRILVGVEVEDTAEPHRLKDKCQGRLTRLGLVQGSRSVELVLVDSRLDERLETL